MYFYKCAIFKDYLTPVDEREDKICSNNKWNYPPYKPGKTFKIIKKIYLILYFFFLYIKDAIRRQLFDKTICMDSRYQISKHYNIHGLYSHLMIESTAKYRSIFI